MMLILSKTSGGAPSEASPYVPHGSCGLFSNRILLLAPCRIAMLTPERAATRVLWGIYSGCRIAHF